MPLKNSNCFQFARQMIKALPGLKVRKIFFNVSGIVALVEDTGASEQEERFYRLTLQPTDNPGEERNV